MQFSPLVLHIVNILNLVTLATPEAIKVYDRAKELFQMWFLGGVITKEQQELLMTWADRHQAATLAGEVPPALLVEPDPS